MNESVTIPQERPSILGSFFKGAMSSAFSGALMAGIVALVTPFAPVFIGAAMPAAIGTAIWAAFTSTAPLMILATGLFGGAMGVKRAMFDAPSAGSSQPTFIPIPVGGVSGPALSVPAVSADMAAVQDQPTKNWVADTAREGNAKQRIQQIIASGRTGDRTNAILAARETAAANDNGRNA